MATQEMCPGHWHALYMRWEGTLGQEFLETHTNEAGRNEPVVPSAVVRLGRLGSGGSARRWCRPADSAGRTNARHFGRPSRPAGLPEPNRLAVRPAGGPAELPGRSDAPPGLTTVSFR